MKCPLFVVSALIKAGTTKNCTLECLQEECAWWSPLESCCAVRDLSGLLLAMGNTLGKIADNMPKEHQFRDR